MIKKIPKWIWILVGLIVVLALLSIRHIPEKINYGVSFSKFHADELGLNWKEVYGAVLNDLGVKNLRLSAHWPMIEPEEGKFDFDAMDYQMNEARKHDASVILAVGRRLPGWPECHEPDWATKLSWEDEKTQILSYLTAVVTRYKSYDNIKYWQVENEPFLTVFAQEHCGTLDSDFLKQEIALVRKLDPNHKILVTDSGNLGLWQGAWRSADAFGTSVYIYLWNPTLGKIKSVYQPFVYRIKRNVMSLLFGNKDALLIELSAEPWLLEPIVSAPMSTLLERMSIDDFSQIIDFAKKTSFSDQYLWGVEWWYWMKSEGHPEYWQKAESVFGAK